MKLTLLIIDSPVKMPDIFRTGTSRRVSMFGDVNNVELGSEFAMASCAGLGRH